MMLSGWLAMLHAGLMHKPTDVAYYSGLVIATAALHVGRVPYEFDDIVQLLYIKVWEAIPKHDPKRSKVSLEEYVFGCVRNRVKDLYRKRRSPEIGYDDAGFQSQDSLEHQFGAVDRDVVYREVEEAGLQLPNTLTAEELGVIELLTSGYRQAEAARFLGWPHQRMLNTMTQIRLKLADWKPDADPSVPDLLAV